MRVQLRRYALPASQIWMLAGLAVALIASLINPLYPENTYLHQAPTLALLIGLPVLLWRYPMTDASVACVVAFLLLHSLGAYYSYSFVPYDDWARLLLGHEQATWAMLGRNHYDRFVHLAFGMLTILPARELLVRHLGVLPRVAALGAVAAVLSGSLSYEVFEWLLAIIMSPEAAEIYNGQQGDMFDGQKDMALAAAGALLTTAALGLPRRARD